MSNSTMTGEAGFNLYGYTPSKTAAYAYVGLFAASGFAHFVFIFSLRSPFFVPLILGCASKPLLPPQSEPNMC